MLEIGLLKVAYLESSSSSSSSSVHIVLARTAAISFVQPLLTAASLPPAMHGLEPNKGLSKKGFHYFSLSVDFLEEASCNI